MTRGTAYLVLPKGRIISSCEFNGDMYPGGHYEEMVARLQRVVDEETFKLEIIGFDDKNFDYQSEGNGYFKFHTNNSKNWENKDGQINMGKDYFGRFFSDYLFWKNLSGKPIYFKDKKRKVIELGNNQILTFNFGEIHEKIIKVI